MSNFALSGLSTGLDTSSIIEQLMSIERRPQNAMKTQSATQSKMLDRMRLLNTKFLALENAAKAVMGVSAATSPFGAKSASSSNPAVFTASATSGATAGTYTVDVLSLAKAQKAGGNVFSAPTGNGVLTITNGTNTANINITAGDSVDTVAAAINADAASGLAASVVGGRLIVLGKQTGAAEQYTLSGSYGTLVNELGLQASGSDVAASDASMNVSGVLVTSGSNTFTNAVSGVTLNAVTVGAGATMTIGNDNTAATTAIKDMLAKYNDIINQIKTDTKYDVTAKAGGPLASDTFTKGLTAQLNRMVSDPFGTGVQNGGLLNFSDAGITIARDGTLALDEAKLNAQLAAKPSEVLALFTREDGAVDGGSPTVKLNQGANGGNLGDGIANRLRAFANTLTSAASDYNYIDGGGARYRGSLLARMDGIQSRIDDLSNRVESFELRLQKRESSLRSRFVAMEKAVALIRNQGSYLSNQYSQQ